MVVSEFIERSIRSLRVLAVSDDCKSRFGGRLRLEAAAMAALSTTENGGLIPHAWHGGRGVEELALAGSKLEGTELEKEQIVHIQVAFDSGILVVTREGPNGLFALETGDEEAPRAMAFLLSVCCMEPWPRFSNFGWNVIFGEDFKKPAWADYEHLYGTGRLPHT
jgi:hypothetical protein